MSIYTVVLDVSQKSGPADKKAFSLWLKNIVREINGTEERKDKDEGLERISIF